MTEEAKTLHILSHPYEDRKFICFYDEIELERQISKEQGEDLIGRILGTIFFGGIATALLALAILYVTDSWWGLILAVPFAALGGFLGLVLKKGWGVKFIYTKKYSFGDAANPKYIWKLGQSDVSGIIFPAGHPKNNIVYVGHPFMPNTYFPSFNFHRELFLEKYFEAIKILRSLGADEIEIHHVAGWAQDWASVAGLSLGALEFRNNATGFNRSSSEIIGKWTFDPSGREPKVPPDIIWFKTERAWQEIARARLEDKLREFDMSLTYEDDFGINKKFLARLKA